MRASGPSDRPGPVGVLYRPAEVAKMLRCSEWWVKEQARKRRIPFTWIGGSYLFTEQHVAEVIRLFEQRPDRAGAPEDPVNLAARRNKAVARPRGVTLTARTPKRRVRAVSDSDIA